ncbi:MAG: DNA methyltransferase [Acidimicrobiia bacterium]
MRNWFHVRSELPRPDRPAGYDDDVEYSEALVEHFVDLFTEPGDVVLDPFMGFGTTLMVAERMGRRAIGIEMLPERAEYVRGRVADPASVITGDARELRSLGIGAIDFSMTSPPYMTKDNHPENPLNAYESLDGDYDRYLVDLRDVYVQVAELLKPDRVAVVNVANIRYGGPEITPLAWDVGRALSDVLHFEGEVVVCYDIEPPELTNDYCLVFRKQRTRTEG